MTRSYDLSFETAKTTANLFLSHVLVLKKVLQLTAIYIAYISWILNEKWNKQAAALTPYALSKHIDWEDKFEWMHDLISLSNIC